MCAPIVAPCRRGPSRASLLTAPAAGLRRRLGSIKGIRPRHDARPATRIAVPRAHRTTAGVIGRSASQLRLLQRHRHTRTSADGRCARPMARELRLNSPVVVRGGRAGTLAVRRTWAR